MDDTNKKWIVWGLLVSVLLMGMGLLGLKIYQNNQAKQDREFATMLKINEPEGVAGVQKNGNYDYDTTEHKAMFVIEGVEAGSRTMRLKFVLPAKLRDNVITSKVTCSKRNTWIFTKPDNVVVPADKTIYEEERIRPGGTIMQARCSDKYCRMISKYCEIWL